MMMKQHKEPNTTNAGVLRRIAGCPAAWQAQRDGSFLVVVVGTLALLAVIMLVYVGVGNQDVRTKAALAKRERIDDVPKQFADYLSERVIGADALATHYSLDDRNITSLDDPTLTREATDYPYTDWTRRSDSLDRADAFTPIGSYVRLPAATNVPTSDAADAQPAYVDNAGLPTAWIWSDPWLASTEPTWLGYNADPLGNNFEPANMRRYVYNPGELKRDWPKISNVGPDGKYVNLYNLAPMVGGRRVGNLDAKPGFGVYETFPRLSEGLSLLRGNDNIGPADDTTNQTAWGSNVNNTRNFPAYWDSWQRGAFRIAVDDRVTGGNSSYLPYQWADADGDGMFDSRWMQLTDSRIFDATGDLSGIKNLLETDGKFRYFFAVRIIDASGLVNVNTATDQLAGPDANNPVGLTPADIDLRRLLTLTDSYDGFRSDPTQYPNGGDRIPGYAGLVQPIDPLLAASYQRYGIARAELTGGTAYNALRLSLASGQMIPLTSSVNPADQYRGTFMITNSGGGFAESVFNKGTDYASNDRNDRRFARRLWNFGPALFDDGILFPVRDDVGGDILTTAHSPLLPLFTGNIGAGTARIVPSYPTFARRRGEFFDRAVEGIDSAGNSFVRIAIGGGGNTPPNTSRSFTATRPFGQFGIDSLSELITYRASNDIDVLSDLERVLGGRDIANIGDGDQLVTRYDPLRSNRGPDLELARSQPDGSGFEQRVLRQFDTDIRQRLTTVSGARPIYSRVGVDMDEIKVDELRVNTPLLLSTIANAGGNSPLALDSVNKLFGYYVQGLAPYVGLNGSWDRSNATAFGERKTLFYGYDGPEAAVLTAAHMAVNMADIADIDTEPSSYTLLLNNTYRTNIATPTSPFFNWRHSNAATPDGRRLDVDAALGGNVTKLATGAGATQLRAPAVDVYGIEPHPSITAVATFTLYTDTPDGQGIGHNYSAAAGRRGDADGVRPSLPSDPREEITIRRDVSAGNSDLLYRVVAFRLHNPFNVRLRLGDPSSAILPPTTLNGSTPFELASEMDIGQLASTVTPDRQRDFYYIQFGGRRFMLSALKDRVSPSNDYFPISGNQLDVTSSAIVIEPGQSVVCYAMSQLPRAALDRAEAVDATWLGSTRPQRIEELRNLIRRQLRQQDSGITTARETLDENIHLIGEIDPDATDSGASYGMLTQSATTNDTGTFNPFVVGANAFPDRFGQLLRQNFTGESIKPDFANGTPEQVRLMENTSVEVWRAVRRTVAETTTSVVNFPGTTWNGGTVQTTPRPSVWNANDFRNDLLVDRLRVPFDSTLSGENAYVNLDARLSHPSDVPTIDAPVNGSDDSGTTLDIYDGATVMVWAAARRPQDPRIAIGSDIPAGAFPGFCLEIKDWGNYDSGATRESWNTFERQSQTSGIVWTDLEADYFTSRAVNRRAGDTSLAAWKSNQDGSTNDPQSQAISKPMTTVLTANASSAIQSTLTRAFPTNSTKFGQAYDTHYVNPTVGMQALRSADRASERVGSFFVSSAAGETHTTFRVADVLLPLGVGPSRTPLDGALVAIVDNNILWTTLAESLAASLGFERTAELNATDVTNLVLPRNLGGGVYRHMLDRGALVIDDFVPFLNTDLPGGSTFTAGSSDQRMLTQSPLALNLLDVFGSGVGGPPSLTRSVPGLININTASLAVMRALPLVSPPPTWYYNPTANVTVRENEIQVLRLGSSKDDYRITIPLDSGSVTTGVLRYGATATEVKFAIERALEAAYTSAPGQQLPVRTFPAGSVNVSAIEVTATADGVSADYVGGSFIVTFVGELSGYNVGQLGLVTASGGALAGASVVTINDGQNVSVSPRWWADGTSLNANVDLAATIVSYRDKIETLMRPQSFYKYDGAAAGVIRSVRYMEFDDTASRTTPDHPVDEVISRSIENNISGVGEIPGYSSLGALLTARYSNRGVGPSPLSPYERSFTTNIDFMGYEPSPETLAPRLPGPSSKDHSIVGVDSLLGGSRLPLPAPVNPTPANQPTGTPSAYIADVEVPSNLIARTDSMQGEFKERLNIANGVLNTISTRSDYYIAWFVVHGYQQSDVDNLGLNDVLSPTIARRFIMVVDRSNVVKSGDKPEVLLFKEVPYKGN